MWGDEASGVAAKPKADAGGLPESVAKLSTEGRVVLHCATGGRAGGAYCAILGESDYVNKQNLQYLDKTITVNADGTFVIE